MITLQQFTNWNIRPFRTFRFLEKQHVDDFLNNGKLRLSSFSKFRQHKDEIRGDNKEGSGWYLANYKPEVGKGHSFGALMNTGMNAYILCTSQVNNKNTFRDCNYDSGFLIKDVFGFALEISRAIPFFIGGMEGQCFYTEAPDIHIDMGQFNIDDLSDQEKQIKQNEFFEKTKQDTDIFFIKRSKHKDQEEYRILWFADKADEYLDILCSNARQFCEII
jgi:hypothetical protein